MATAAPILLVCWVHWIMVGWYVSPKQTGLPWYVWGYGSNKAIGKAHSIGLVLQVPIMDQTCKIADLLTHDMYANHSKTILLREEALSKHIISFDPRIWLIIACSH